MKGVRGERLSSQFREEISRVIATDLRNRHPELSAIISITEADVAPDLKSAKIYVSIFPSDKAESVMNILEENSRALRGELGNRIGRQLRIVPEIAFFRDDSLDYVEHIEELLKK